MRTHARSLSFRDLIRTSRPLLWLNTAVLWVLGLLALGQPPTVDDIVMMLYFTLPFNLWLHGINDVYDYDSDLLNPRKGSDEGALLPEPLHGALLRAALWWNLPFMAFALWRGTPLSALLLALFLFLGWGYSAPPLRGKGRPFLDSLINAGYLLPYFITLAWHAAPPLAWRASLPAIVAFAAWSIASHAFTSIQDIEADRAGGLATVATVLGAVNTSRFALVGYGLSMAAAVQYGFRWGVLLVPYVVYVTGFLRRPTREFANRLYRLFIATNSAVGFIITVTLALASPKNTGWAAAVLLALILSVVAARGYVAKTE